MKHTLLLIAAIFAVFSPQPLGAEESLPIIESSAKLLTVRSEFMLNGRKVPFSKSIRMDTIVAVYENVLEPPRADGNQPTTQDDRTKIPVDIFISTTDPTVKLRICGLTSTTAPAVYKKLVAVVDNKEVDAETQNEK